MPGKTRLQKELQPLQLALLLDRRKPRKGAPFLWEARRRSGPIPGKKEPRKGATCNLVSLMKLGGECPGSEGPHCPFYRTLEGCFSSPLSLAVLLGMEAGLGKGESVLLIAISEADS